MTDLTTILNALNAGELSPLLDGRTDQEKYFSGCKVMQNYIPTVQGPATRRGGTRYIGGIKDDERAWLTPFVFSQAQSYNLEFGDNYLRFWVNRGQLLSGMSPYELATPWTAADLMTSEGTFSLRTVQSGDIMWATLSDGSKKPQKLSRFAATTWTLVDVPFLNGPFNDVNPLATIVVRASDVSGAITLEANAALFRASDVGTSFFLQNQSFAEVQPWVTDHGISAGDICRFEGNYYRAVAVGTAGKTGAAPPVHLGGSAKDGDDNVTWLYLHSGYGWVRITAFTDSTHVNATVLSYIPDSIVVNGGFPPPVLAGQAPPSGNPNYEGGTNRWARAAFNDTDGWPTSVAFFRERLIWGRGRTAYGSIVKSFDDFTRFDGPDITKETSISLQLAIDKLDEIRWLAGSRALLLGGPSSEASIQEQTTQTVFAADNATGTPQTEFGSTLLEPLRVGANGSAILFVQRSGRKMRELKYNFSVDAYEAEDLTVLSEHILDAGVIDMDFQQEPDNIAWCVMADGSLSALTYNRERGVIAWAPHYLGAPGYAITPNSDGKLDVANYGVVESVSVIAQPDGKRDDVWLIVRRTINGQTKRYVEIIEDNRLVKQGLAQAFYADCGISRPGGSPTTTISGLGHLEGCSVDILTDGSPHPRKTVTGGSITLDRLAVIVHVGFNAPAPLKTMRIDAGGQGGTMQTKMKSLASVWFRLVDTLGGAAGPDFDRLDRLKYLDPDDTVGAPLALFNGDKEVVWPATYDTDGYICFIQDQMLPATVAAVVGRLDPAEDSQ